MKITFSRKHMVALAVVVLSGLFIFGAYAQTPSSSVNLGALALSGFSGLAGSSPYLIGNAPTNSIPMNGSMMSNSSMNNSSVNSAQPLAVINLSNYASDRRSNNLTGYTNIMYPLAESSGFTASAAGGGGCNCGGG